MIPLGARPGFHLILLGLIYLSLINLAGLNGEFPLNDDWAYSQSVQSLLETGRPSISGMEAMTLIGHVLWGALFCLPFGFSFLALRISVMCLGLLGIFTTYGLLREARIPNQYALAGALLVAVNPLYFELSFTFMTDLPFYALSTTAAYLLLKGIRKDKYSLVLAGSLFIAAAALIRQLAVFIPLAFLLSLLLSREGSLAKRLSYSFLPLVLMFAALLLYALFVQPSLGFPDLIKNANRDLMILAENAIKRLVIIPVYLGLFLIPFTGVLQPPRKQIWIPLSVFLGIVGLWWVVDRQLPFLGNILYDTGLGPATLRDVAILHLAHLPSYPILWFFLTLAGIGMACLSGYWIVAQARSLKQENRFAWLFAAFCCLIYFVPMAWQYSLFDRHMLPFLPFLMILILPRQFPALRLKLKNAALFVGLAAFAYFSVVATHDYLSWNRARWEALDDLAAEGIKPEQIDGGFEFNGYYTFSLPYTRIKSKSWWWVRDDTYIISFGPIRGYEQVEAYRYERWLDWDTGYILVLKKRSIVNIE